jgi:hypothetical protein
MEIAGTIRNDAHNSYMTFLYRDYSIQEFRILIMELISLDG